MKTAWKAAIGAVIGASLLVGAASAVVATTHTGAAAMVEYRAHPDLAPVPHLKYTAIPY